MNHVVHTQYLDDLIRDMGCISVPGEAISGSRRIAMVLARDGSMWRVNIGTPVEVMHFEDSTSKATIQLYDTEDHLPRWIQDAVRNLRMINCDDPTDYIAGIGRRLSNNVFWIERVGDGT